MMEEGYPSSSWAVIPNPTETPHKRLIVHGEQETQVTLRQLEAAGAQFFSDHFLFLPGLTCQLQNSPH